MEEQAYMEQCALIHQVLQNHMELYKVRYSQHAGERIEERNITRRLVKYILYHYEPTEMHEVGKYSYVAYPLSNNDTVLTVVDSYEERIVAIRLVIKQYYSI
ncbi:DUF4258 domain-containing protein [Paenibacillus sp. PsM32]|uniref:DUF4258 domain-containing protein n=1 Tax=unclassified Paenibacillus TaxID=185978 RepID=UPI0023666CD6|nr:MULTISPECIES: DUF4258 domain-containing protein [unclassified Paenibacillus]MDN4617633.1 DUF4258 domain-containing protein [Paenibacillus sp. PsM32]WDF52910.1 DUF4258 domain-containing protein [Paenibacillus sp. KACC 21273]